MARQDILKEIKSLKDFIALEKEEEYKQYVSALQNHSLKEQRNMGVCWYPVKVMRSGYDAGERLLVRVARMPEHQQSHAFQSGKPVRIFSNTDNRLGETDFVSAVVNSVDETEMLLTINAEELPEWLDEKYLGVQLLFDENVYREMNVALDYLLSTKEENIQRLMHVLLGDVEARFTDLPETNLLQLNQSQNEALNKVLKALDVAIIHGPPGTGKTTTLVESVIETLKSERQTMVTAASNAAVDLLVEKLYKRGVQVVRIGHPARVNEEVLQSTLDFLYTRHESYKDLKAVRKQAEEFQQMAAKYKRNFGEEEREQRRLLFAEARKLRQEARHLSYFITADILAKAQVIACTLHGASNTELKGFRFQTVFIDEASQALEPASWIPIIKANRVVFAGDHQQLPPTIKSYKAAQEGFQVTLFEKAILRNKADVMLREQYRMNEVIMGFSSQMFYANSLIANEKVANHLMFPDDFAFEFIDTAGTGFFEETDPETKSTFNREEANVLLLHFQQYIEELEMQSALRNLVNVGIISPYKAQVEHIKSVFRKNEHIPPFVKSFTAINTVDSFQGQERDVIYISFTRSNEKNEIGFLSDIRRMNVAMTRARKKLILIGDSATLAKHPFYAALLDYIQAKALYRSAFEYSNFS